MDLDSLLERAKNSKLSNNNNVKSYRAIKKRANQYPASKIQCSAQVGTRINAGLKKRISEFVLARHGKLSGVYSKEVEEMLEIGLAYKQQQTTNPAISLSGPNIHRTDVMNNLMKIRSRLRLFQEGDQYPIFHLNTIRKIINGVLARVVIVGSREVSRYADKRTQRKYLKIVLTKSSEKGTAQFDLWHFINSEELK